MEKIAEIDVHVGAAMSGLVADARTLVDHARVEAQNHRFTYDEPIGVEALTQGELSEVIHSLSSYYHGIVDDFDCIVEFYNISPNPSFFHLYSKHK